MDFTPLTQISSSSAMGGRSASQSQENPNEIGKLEFMKLLVAQLENQDPMNPSDAQEFTAQLATFSSLEQMISMNKSLETVAMLQSSMNNAQAANFIGKNIKALGSNVYKSGDTETAIEFDLTDASDQVAVEIYDESGRMVRREELGAKNAGPVEYVWNGRDSVGAPLPDGAYSYSVIAEGPTGEQVLSNTFSTGKVDGVVFDGGLTYLDVGGKLISISDIMEIH